MRVKIRLKRSTDDPDPIDLYEGGFRRGTPLGLFATPQLDLPSGIALTVRAKYSRKYDMGELWVESAGALLVHVAPLRRPLDLRLRLTSGEVLWVSATANRAR